MGELIRELARYKVRCMNQELRIGDLERENQQLAARIADKEHMVRQLKDGLLEVLLPRLLTAQQQPQPKEGEDG